MGCETRPNITCLHMVAIDAAGQDSLVSIRRTHNFGCISTLRSRAVHSARSACHRCSLPCLSSAFRVCHRFSYVLRSGSSITPTTSDGVVFATHSPKQTPKTNAEVVSRRAHSEAILSCPNLRDKALSTEGGAFGTVIKRLLARCSGLFSSLVA